MPDFLQQPKVASEQNSSFADEEEIKILERRLALLREGLKPHEAAQSGGAKEEKEGAEAAEGGGVGEGPGAPLPPLPQAPALPVSDTHYHEAKVSELKSYESDKQLKALVEIAFERSLSDAVDIARRLDDAYLLDAFHDVLVDDEKLHKALVESGKLREV